MPERDQVLLPSNNDGSASRRKPWLQSVPHSGSNKLPTCRRLHGTAWLRAQSALTAGTVVLVPNVANDIWRTCAGTGFTSSTSRRSVFPWRGWRSAAAELYPESRW
jgi:hypothetical protein